jgi:hypothetical protein
MKIIFWLAAISMLASFHATMADQPSALVMGIGAKTCAGFAEEYRQDPDHWEIIYFSWAQGWMSGVNTANIQTARNVNSVPVPDQKMYLRRYCDEHPSDNYVDAVVQLFQMLKPATY